MSASRLSGQRAHPPHVCVACSRSFVYPDFGLREGGRWRVILRCASCGWSGQRLLDDAALEDFERELDDERECIESDLELLAEHNMRDYCHRFIAALAADAVMPEDF